MPPIYDQGKLNSSSVHAVIAAFEYLIYNYDLMQ